MSKESGMTYTPTGKTTRVVREGEFVFAAAYLDHGHIFGQTQGLLEAGGSLKFVYDPDANKVANFCQKFPQAKPVDCLQRILDDASIHLVASAAVPNERGSIGLKVLDAGKDYFSDKSPFTTLNQLKAARRKVDETGRKHMVYYSERLHNESAWHAGELIHNGAVGRVLQALMLAPHRLSKENRPQWFFEKKKYGGILTDIGSHQFEQFLFYSGAKDATVNTARVENFANSDTPELEDFGEASLTADNGASCYCRVDWFTPDGQSAWGDGRTFILGTEGVMEIRKYTDVARGSEGDLIFLTDRDGEHEISCAGKIGFPFFGQLILDVLNRTDKAMSQEHVFKAAELCMQAQKLADQTRIL